MNRQAFTDPGTGPARDSLGWGICFYYNLTPPPSGGSPCPCPGAAAVHRGKPGHSLVVTYLECFPQAYMA